MEKKRKWKRIKIYIINIIVFIYILSLIFIIMMLLNF